MPCLFPAHHKSGGGGGLVVLFVTVAAALLVYHFLHAIELAAAVVLVLAVIVFGWKLRRHLRTVAGIVMLAVWFTRLTWRFPHASPATRRNYPHAVRAHASWRWLCRNLSLGRPDSHVADRTKDGRDTGRPRLLHPQVRISPDDYGIRATMRTVPGVGRQQVEDVAGHLADHWGAARVSVAQLEPGRLEIRAMRRDPLLESFGLELAPPGLSVRKLWLGRDEHGNDRFADLANCPGIVLGGMPGSGKSTELTSFLAQLAPCDAVQFITLDGKASGEFDDFRPRAWMTQGDSLDEAIAVLEEVHDLMTARLATVRDVLGHKNAWHAGPAVDWPLIVLIIDECQTFLDLTAVKGDRDLEAKVRRAITLVSSLVRKGRSAMMLTVPATQKPTTDSLPSSIRDNCPISMCFGVKTADAAVATLGSSIRQYESYSPVSLADPAYAGCATVTLRTGADPFTRLRGPWVTEDQAAAAADATAHLRRVPSLAVPVAIPDDARELVS